MTTRPHARAGTYYTPPMDCAQAGCNAPQSECLGLCMHRVHPSQVEQVNAMPINFAGPEPVEAEKVQQPEPVEVVKPLIAAFLGIFKKEWK